MIKLLSAMLSASMLFILSFFFGPAQPVNVDIEAPSRVRPGDDFVYQLTVNKGTLNGFSRIQIFIPQGLTVSPLEVKNAQFLFEEDYVKFIWIQLPEESEFKVSMKVHVDASAEGEKYLNGELSFIENDKTEKIALKQTAIQLDPSLPKTADGSKPEVERKLVTLSSERGEYQVELTIHPNQEQSAARFIDDIPEGYTATMVDAHGAEFSFTDQSAIFSWKSLPAEPFFTFIYKVVGGENKQVPNINGMLVYGDQMLTTNSGTAGISPGEMKEAEATPAPEEVIIDALVEAENNRSQLPSEAGVAQEQELHLPAPQSGIYYKVQISATRKSPVRDNKWFSSKYNWEDSVDLTYHDGWKKYLIGTFQDYKRAKDLRNRTSAKLSDAFVVAYENGQRIPVQDAVKAEKINQ